MPKDVYFIDDDSLFLKLAKFHCKDSLPCATGIFYYEHAQEALEIILQKIDATETDISIEIFLDINMPGMNGFEFIDSLVERNPKTLEFVNIYMLSSSTNPDDFQKANERFVVKNFLQKPLKKEYLLALCTE